MRRSLDRSPINAMLEEQKILLRNDIIEEVIFILMLRFRIVFYCAGQYNGMERVYKLNRPA